MEPEDESPRGFIREIWGHSWGRVLMIAMTIAVTSWALRETAVVTWPIITTLGGIALPLAIGFTIAYVLTPVVEGLSRLGIHRLISTSILFLCFALVTLIVGSLVVPAVINQSTDLAGRVVDEITYYDVNGNRRFDGADILLMPVVENDVQRPGVFFEDVNRNGQRDGTELLRNQNEPGVQREPSIMSRLAGWFERRTERLRLLMGGEWNQISMSNLSFYEAEVHQPLQDLDDALAVVGSDERLLAWLALPPPEVDAPVDPQAVLAWPGVTATTVATARDQVPEDRREAWEERLRLLLAVFALRHKEVLTSFDTVDATSLEETDMIRRLRETRAKGPDQEASTRDVAFLERVQAGEEHGDRFAEELYGYLLTTSTADNSFVRRLANSFDASITAEMDSLPAAIGRWLKGLLSNVRGLMGLALDIILIPIYAFFLTLSMPALRQSVRALVPRPGRERTLRILHAIERVVAAFFRGRLIVCSICTVLVYVGFALLGVPYAALFAVFIGLATTVPLLGLVFLVPALLLTAIDDGENLAMRITLVSAVYVVVQTLEAVVFTPTIMGKEVELHPVMLIMALLVFGNLLGILGLILAVPIAATLRILAREFLFPRLGIEFIPTGRMSRPRVRITEDEPAD